MTRRPRPRKPASVERTLDELIVRSRDVRRQVRRSVAEMKALDARIARVAYAVDRRAVVGAGDLPQ
jgi:hypothetical protein